MLNFLTSESLIKINQKLGYQILNKSLVGSALSGWQYYSSLEEQIASVIKGIAKNHAFQDGNKRTAVIVYFNLCALFNLKPLSDDEMFSAIIEIAKSQKSVTEIAKDLFKTA